MESNMDNTTEGHEVLKRQAGLPGATLMGLGSILGTGVFVSIGIAAGAAGSAVVIAIGLAALVAMCNAFSSAQLAASHPVSGGTYEYGYKYLNPAFGFTAGWMFLIAKSMSAATAALGFSGYLLHILGVQNTSLFIPIAAGMVILLTLIVLSGMKQSLKTNTIIVTLTITSLLVFIIFGLSAFFKNASGNLLPFFGSTPSGRAPVPGFLEGTALMLVAFTGYGRIATLGEEVHEPRRIIPRAILTTLAVSAFLYILIGLVAVGSAGADGLSKAVTGDAAPLETVARLFKTPWVAVVVSIGAVTSMLGVLLNLILGLSRVLLAMGRRQDMPSAAAKLNEAQTTPYVSVIVVGLIIGLLTLIGSVKTTWSFSAFTVLVYYAITNLAALRIKEQDRLYSRWFAVFGLLGCLFLAFWVDLHVWLIGLGLIGIGLIWHMFRNSSACEK